MTEEKNFLLGEVESAEGHRITVLLGEFDTPDDAVKRANHELEGRYLGSPIFTLPITLFLIEGKKIPLELKKTLKLPRN